MTEPAKAGLICTSNYMHSVNHDFPGEQVNNPKFASFLTYVKFVAYTYTNCSELRMCLQSHKIGCADKTCFTHSVTYIRMYVYT